MIVLKDMDYKSVSELKSKIENVEHVSKVIWYDSFVDLDIPVEMMPSELKDAFNTEDSTLMMVIFDDTSSGDGTMEAIGNIRKVADKQCFISGISAIVTDTKELSEKETEGKRGGVIFDMITHLWSMMLMPIKEAFNYLGKAKE